LKGVLVLVEFKGFGAWEGHFDDSKEDVVSIGIP
jgi:hypothetical protein